MTPATTTDDANLKGLFTHPNLIVECLQTIGEIVPLRQFRLLVPLWEVHISGQQRESRDYALLERFIERGIAEGELRTAGELERFFGLPPQIVAKMLTFLRGVGHLEGDDEHLRLSALGQESLRSGSFQRDLATHRLLYFEAFYSRPLPRDYYDLRILSEDEAARLRDRTIYRLYSEQLHQRFVPQELAALQQRANREQFNLPPEIHSCQIERLEQAYFPVTAVEVLAYDPRTRAWNQRFMAISRLRERRDTFFEDLINQVPTIAYSFPDYNEQDVYKRLQNWLESQGVSTSPEVQIARSEAGMWRIKIAPALLSRGTRSPLRISDLGNYRQENGYFFQLWCDAPNIRRQSALEQTLTFATRRLKNQQPTSREGVEHFLGHVARRLAVATPTWQDLEKFASSTGQAAVLDDLNDEPREEQSRHSPR